jgi:hypothetical protein
MASSLANMSVATSVNITPFPMTLYSHFSRMFTVDFFRILIKILGEQPLTLEQVYFWQLNFITFFGVTSLRWITSLKTDQWVAVTASPQMKKQVRSKMKKKMRTNDHILLGTWSSEQLHSEVKNVTNGKKFDVVIADYLVGNAIPFLYIYW